MFTWSRRLNSDTRSCWEANKQTTLKKSTAHSPFLVRPIWPSLGALCPSLWGLAPPPSPLTWGCPGLYCPAGPGCRGGPLDGMSSGIPEAPYIAGEAPSPDWPLDVRTAQALCRVERLLTSAMAFNNECMNNRRQNVGKNRGKVLVACERKWIRLSKIALMRQRASSFWEVRTDTSPLFILK